ncbi:hypothetical protein CANCADRAFT_57994 [Tortispora caseinolytica NRRL Y-17796]|uniref:Uncharacterized protein n=1 Tax=Tortispora caseinolytica NRRL Y-17796 TaxID=767744 RepID=A0A1E4TBB2_9ASCO|nr:hypothetical protein CANCADRAFT_57994 [Tortispora caseinolytica NRRL Y-17796]
MRSSLFVIALSYFLSTALAATITATPAAGIFKRSAIPPYTVYTSSSVGYFNETCGCSMTTYIPVPILCPGPAPDPMPSGLTTCLSTFDSSSIFAPSSSVPTAQPSSSVAISSPTSSAIVIESSSAAAIIIESSSSAAYVIESSSSAAYVIESSSSAAYVTESSSSAAAVQSSSIAANIRSSSVPAAISASVSALSSTDQSVEPVTQSSSAERTFEVSTTALENASQVASPIASKSIANGSLRSREATGTALPVKTASADQDKHASGNAGPVVPTGFYITTITLTKCEDSTLCYVTEKVQTLPYTPDMVKHETAAGTAGGKGPDAATLKTNTGADVTGAGVIGTAAAGAQSTTKQTKATSPAGIYYDSSASVTSQSFLLFCLSAFLTFMLSL